MQCNEWCVFGLGRLSHLAFTLIAMDNLSMESNVRTA